MPLPILENGILPPGEHLATLDEVEIIFGSQNDRRQNLMRGLRLACEMFQKANVNRIWIDGSFVTEKEYPNDIDGCWGSTNSKKIQWQKIDQVFAGDRQNMKNKYGLDFFYADFIEAASGKPFPKFFQTSRDGDVKGIILITLETEEV
jgi:hypothetical protein